MTDPTQPDPTLPDPSGARRPVRRALVSVYDKAGLPELAAGLHKLGVEIVSTGSTAQHIADAGVPVVPVEELTGFPECLDGRVKTLHPRVHAGLLADTRRPEHLAQLDELHERIKTEERRLLVGTVAALARGGATVSGREVTIP